MRVRSKAAFYDREAGTMRSANEVFDAARPRAEELRAAGVAEPLDAAPDAPARPAPARARKGAGRA